MRINRFSPPRGRNKRRLSGYGALGQNLWKSLYIYVIITEKRLYSNRVSGYFFVMLAGEVYGSAEKNRP